MRFRLSLFEIFLLETIVMLAIWLLNDYLGLLLTLIVSVVVFGVLLIALIAELIERSKVPRKYFYIMGISILAFLSSGLIYLFINSV